MEKQGGGSHHNSFLIKLFKQPKKRGDIILPSKNASTRQLPCSLMPKQTIFRIACALLESDVGCRSELSELRLLQLVLLQSAVYQLFVVDLANRVNFHSSFEY